jgi:hypothetical protein
MSEHIHLEVTIPAARPEQVYELLTNGAKFGDATGQPGKGGGAPGRILLAVRRVARRTPGRTGPQRADLPGLAVRRLGAGRLLDGPVYPGRCERDHKNGG